MTATVSNSNENVRADSDDRNTLLDDHSLRSFQSATKDWTASDQAHAPSFRYRTAIEADICIDDHPLLAVPSDDPTPMPLPVLAAELEAAAVRLRPDPAVDKALKRLLQGGWNYGEDDALVITFAPRSRGRKGKPAKPYLTTAHSCTCLGAAVRGGCYHLIAWQIVNEARTPTTSLECALPSATFLPLCLLALSRETDVVTLCVNSGGGTLSVRSSIATATIAVEIATPVLLHIEQQVRAAELQQIIDKLLEALPFLGEEMVLEIDANTLLVIAGTVDAPTFVDGLTFLPTDKPTNLLV
jgi:hypothetical protein